MGSGYQYSAEMQKNVMVILQPQRREKTRLQPDLGFFDSVSRPLDHAVALKIWGKLRHVFYD